MVDFNSNTTVTTPPKNLLDIIIFESKSDVENAIEAFVKVQERSNNYSQDLSIIRSRLLNLFLKVGPAIKRTEGVETWKKMRDTILNANNFKDLIAQYDIINDYLDMKRITRFDTRASYDPTMVSEEDDDAEL